MKHRPDSPEFSLPSVRTEAFWFPVLLAVALFGRLETRGDAPPPTVATVGPVRLRPAADARILENSPTGPAGYEKYLSVYNLGAGTAQHSLVKFDLSALGPNASITNAILRLYADANLFANGNPNQLPMEVYRVTQPWNEGEVTWNNRTTAAKWTNPGGDYVGGTGAPNVAAYATNTTLVTNNYAAISPRLLEWDVTELVKQWYDGTQPNHGLLLLSYSGNQIHMDSVESGVAIPELVVHDANRGVTATEIYSANFEASVGPEWSDTKTSTTPVGARKFLGNFGNQTVQLGLSNLTAHTALEVSFDLYVIASWDGNNTSFGPDQWDLRVVGGPTLLHTTFVHGTPDLSQANDGQAYPGDYPGGRFRPMTGAVETGTLGFTFTAVPGTMNSVYRLTFAFGHSGDTAQLQFSASRLQALSDESWGLDNVVVRAYSAPAGTLQFSRPYFPAVEDGGNAAITVERVGGSAGVVTARVFTANGTALAGTDHAALDATVTFADGETKKTLLIPLVNDAVPEDDEEFTVFLTAPTGGALLAAQSRTTVLVQDDDSTVQLSTATVATPEGNSSVQVTATRVGYANSIASARLRTVADTGANAATSGTDFAALDTVAVFQRGVTSLNFSVGLTDDATVERDETFRVQLSSPFGFKLGTTTTSQVTILDDDTPAGPGIGANASVRDLQVQSDGKFLIAGSFPQVTATARAGIARLNPDGSLDPSFNPGSGANGTIQSVAIQTDGKLVIGGLFTSFNGTARNRVARLNADGSLDGTFNPGTGANGTVNKVLVQPDKQILIAGDFGTVNGSTRVRIARLNPDGTLDPTFNPGTGASAAIFAGVAIQPNGKILASGSFTTFNGTARNRLVRLNTDGSVDNTFDVGSGLNSRASAIIVLGDGNILLGGLFTTYNGAPAVRVARLSATGALDKVPRCFLWLDGEAFQPYAEVWLSGG